MQALKDDDIDYVLRGINLNLAEVGLPYLIYLHAYRVVASVLSRARQSSNLLEHLPNFYELSVQIYPDFYQKVEKQWGQTFQDLKSNKYKELFEKNTSTYSITNSERNSGLIKLIEGVIAVRDEDNKSKLGTMISQLMNYQIDDDLYQEICLNWMREQLDAVVSRMKTSLLCCRSLFRKEEILEANEGRSQEFKRYTWPISAPNIKNHIKKTIVGFLNTHGGIIYVGVYEDKEKKNTVTGIMLDRTKLKEVHDFFRGLVDEVYPKHNGFEVTRETTITRFESNRIPINQYVSLEFLPVVEKQEYYNHRPDKLLDKLYIVKLIVKIGYPKHFYHLINQDQMIDFYVRDDRNVEKKTFPEAHAEVYRRPDNSTSRLQKQ